MKTSLKKLVAIGLCSSLLFSSGIYATPALAAIRLADPPIISSVLSGNAYIPRGTVLQVELVRDISSKTAKRGDSVPLRLVDNLIVNDVIVAPAGSRVRGVITKARRSGGLGRGGTLEFMIISVRTINGVDIPLQYVEGEKAGNDDGAVAVFLFASMVGGVFMKGKNVYFNRGLKFDVEVTADTDLRVSLEGFA